MAKYSKKLDRSKSTILFVKFMQWLGLMSFFIFGIAFLLALLFVPVRMYSLMIYPGLLILFGFVVIPYICRIIVLLTIQIGFSQYFFWVRYIFLFGFLFLATLVFFFWRMHRKYTSALIESVKCMKNTCASTCMPCLKNLPIPM